MKKIVLYGAGKRGYGIYKFLKAKGYENIIYGFCDKKATEIVKIEDKKVYLPDALKGMQVIYCITLLNERKRVQIKKELGKEQCIEFDDLADVLEVDRVKFNREFCAFYHMEDMDTYFEIAENELDIFWGENSEFYRLFQKLDISNIIELACGRGRHVTQYIEKAGKITLVDILQKNIDSCKTRFGKNVKIEFYKNDGYDLKELKSNTYSALYSYDAMVHFEMMDIYSYLREIYRVLKKGGKVLIHHSNYNQDYKASFTNAPHSRSFMSKECFAYLAYRAGFKILEQKIINWKKVDGLDCITLLEK